jgi:Protein of unknown function (DUF1344)
MRKSLIIAAAAASIISSAAFAATATDSIKSIDKTKHTLTLADGKVYDTPATWKATGFKVGDKVTVTYDMKDGKMMASAVAHAS